MLRKYIEMIPVDAMKTAVFVVLILFIIGLDLVTAADTAERYTVDSGMAIRSLGSDIGKVKARMSGTAQDNDLRADVDVHVGWWFLSFSLKSSENASIRGGKLVGYRKTIDTGGHRREIAGERNGDIFTIVISDRGKIERKEFTAKSYEATNMEYPEVMLKPGVLRKMRLIDLENAEIVDREYRHVAEEQIEINGQIIRVVVSDSVDKNAEYRRWTMVFKGLPVVIRQEGREKSGFFNPAYSVRQTSVAAD